MTDLVERLYIVNAGLRAEIAHQCTELLAADGQITAQQEEIERLQARAAVLDGSACAEEQAEGNGPCGVCTQCLRARVAELERDAARYRWLRGRSEDYCGHACFPEVRYRNGLHDGFEAKTVDEAVDAAMGAP